MEKYIIILVLLASIYYIQNKLKESEGFQNVPAQSLGGVDDTNAINTLAQISKQLMAGGLTVPGNMRVQGDISTGEGKVSINNGTINLHSDGGGGLYFLKRGNPGKVEEWNGLHTGNLTVNGGLRVNGNLSPAHSVWHKSTDGIDRIYYGNGNHSYYKTGDSHFFRNRADKDVVAIDGDGVLYAQGRNILAELNGLRAELNELRASKVSINEVVFHKRVGNDGNEGSYFVGDNQHWAGKDNGWTKWRITR
jgi:hypothetical protein